MFAGSRSYAVQLIMKLADLYNQIQNPLERPDFAEQMFGAYGFIGVYKNLQSVGALPQNNNPTKDEKDKFENDKIKFEINLTNRWIRKVANSTPEQIAKGMESDKKFDELVELFKTYPDPAITTTEQYEKFINDQGTKARHFTKEYDSSWAHTISRAIDGRTYDRQKTEHRLYLNLGIDDFFTVAQAFVEKCEKQNLQFYFKYPKRAPYFQDRADNFVLYCSTESLPKYIEILNEIEKEKPQIISRAGRPPILTGHINKWIGIGQEPKQPEGIDQDNKHSFTSYRDPIIYDAIEEIIDPLLPDSLKCTMPDGRIAVTYSTPDVNKAIAIAKNDPGLKAALLQKIKARCVASNIDPEKFCFDVGTMEKFAAVDNAQAQGDTTQNFKKIQILSQQGLDPRFTRAAEDGIRELLACFRIPESGIRIETLTLPKEIEEAGRRSAVQDGRNDPRLEYGPQLNTSFMLQEAYKDKSDSIRVIITKDDLYAHNPLMNFVFGNAGDTRMGVTVQSPIRMADKREELTPIHFERLKSTVMHEVGHFMDLTYDKRKNSEENYGPHCTNPGCTMAQTLNVPEMAEATNIRLQRKRNGQPPICQDCHNAGMAFLARQQVKAKPAPTQPTKTKPTQKPQTPPASKSKPQTEPPKKPQPPPQKLKINRKEAIQNLRIAALLDEYVIIKSKWLLLDTMPITSQRKAVIRQEVQLFKQSGILKANLEKDLAKEPPISQSELDRREEQIEMLYSQAQSQSNGPNGIGQYWEYRGVERNVKHICNLVSHEIKDLQQITGREAKKPDHNWSPELKQLVAEKNACAAGKSLDPEKEQRLRELLAKEGQISCQKFRGEPISQKQQPDNFHSK